MLEALQFDFMQNAVFAGMIAGLMCGIIGTLVVVNRIVFLSGGIAHTAYGGIGLSFFFGWPVIFGTLGFTLFAAIAIAAITFRARHRSDTIIAVLWAGGMALGVVLLDLTPGYNVDLMSYLFGSILAVSDTDVYLMLVMSIIVLGIVVYFYNDFLAMSYDVEFAQLRGVPVRFFYFLIIAMIAVAVVITIRVVGLILVIALLTIPPFLAEMHASTLAKMMALSVLFNVFFIATGLWISYIFDLTSGATIILVAGTVFIISYCIDFIKKSC